MSFREEQGRTRSVRRQFSRDVSLVDGRARFTAVSVVVVLVCQLYHMRLDPYSPSNFPAVSWNKLKSFEGS
jgi:hypothetical protein